MGVIVGKGVSFGIAAALLKLERKKDTSENFEESISTMEKFKGKKSKYFDNKNEETDLSDVELNTTKIDVSNNTNVNKIVFACDAGMGSSAMAAGILKKKVKNAGLNISVTNVSVDNIPAGTDIIVCHEGLYERAKNSKPDGKFVVIKNYLQAPEYDQLISELKGN